MKLTKIALLVCLVTIISLISNNKANAGYADNTSRLYYELSSQVYNHSTAKTIENNLYKVFKPAKYKVIDTIDLSKTNKHEMARSADKKYIKPLSKTGFQAITVVNTSNKRLYIAFAGSAQLSDFRQVSETLESSQPAQVYDAHLYLNYIYNQFPEYRKYKWYLTGHSLGGYLATKSLLDAETKNILIPASRKLLHSGAIKKTISGVYTFNPVTMNIKHFNKGQQAKNTSGNYRKTIHNLVYKNELVHAYQQKNAKSSVYLGTTTFVTDKNSKLNLKQKHQLGNIKKFTK